uniref:Uncharacterized protein n=1 Tax=Cannabis sativa TaxID=3483 RepID=A0A803NM63_CANSA
MPRIHAFTVRMPDSPLHGSPPGCGGECCLSRVLTGGHCLLDTRGEPWQLSSNSSWIACRTSNTSKNGVSSPSFH